MKPQIKKWIIVGSLGAVSVALALAYLQYRKIMDYVVAVKGIRIKSITQKLFNFDLLITLTNKADLKYKILSQDYEVLVNGKFLSKLSNNTQVDVPKRGSVDMAINVQFKPEDILNLLKTSHIKHLQNLQKCSVNLKLLRVMVEEMLL